MTPAPARADTRHVILADVGGTNVRFAVVAGGAIGPIDHLAVGDYAQFADALAAFLSDQPDRANIRRAIFGVAGVVEDGRCALTNNAWVVDAAELCARFGLRQVRLVNDFEALAWSLPHLAPDDIRQIGGREPVARAPMVVLGPGTGLGVAAYVPGETGATVLHSEGGHATAPSGSSREDAIIEVLRGQYGHVSAERMLSGHGLEAVYRAIATIDGLAVPARNAAEITGAALNGDCAASRAAVDTFCAILGDVAGNFALGFGAQGGVFLAAGIVDHLRDYLPQSRFRERFDAKGRMRRYVEAIPAHLILCDDPSFIGLRALAAQPAL